MKPVRFVSPDDATVVVEKQDRLHYSATVKGFNTEQEEQQISSLTVSTSGNTNPCIGSSCGGESTTTNSSAQTSFVHPCIQMSYLADSICGRFTLKPTSAGKASMSKTSMGVYEECKTAMVVSPDNAHSSLVHPKQPQQPIDEIVSSLNVETKEDKFRRSSSEATAETTVSVPYSSSLTTVPQLECGISTKNYWSLPLAHNYYIRGPNYLKDGKKIPSGDFIFPTRGADLFLTNSCPSNVGRNERLLNGNLRKVPTFIVNFRFSWGILVLYFEIPTKFLPFLRASGHRSSISSSSMLGFNNAEKRLCKFLMSSQESMAESLKLIPNIEEGPWIVRKLVTNTPVIIGKKVKCQKFCHLVDETNAPRKNTTKTKDLIDDAASADYIEIDLDIGESIKPRAKQIVSVCRSHMQHLTIDFGLVIEGKTPEDLPEQMLCAIRLHKLDSVKAQRLP